MKTPLNKSVTWMKSTVRTISRKLWRGFRFTSEPGGWTRQTSSRNLMKDQDCAMFQNLSRLKQEPVFGGIITAERNQDKNMRGLSKPRSKVTAFNIRGAPSGPRTAGHNRKSRTDARLPYKTSVSSSNFPSCRGDHDLRKCQDFGKKNHDERIKIVRRARLCYNCFTEGHMAMGCTERSSCGLDGCKRKHITLLHPPNQPNQVDGIHGVQQSSAGTMGSGQCSAIFRGRKVRFGIVPVRVRGKNR